MTKKIAAALIVAAIAGSAAGQVAYIDARPIHLVPTKDEWHRIGSIAYDGTYFDAYPDKFPALNSSGEPTVPGLVDDSTNTLSSDGALEVEYNQYDRWISTGMATRIYYKFAVEKVLSTAGLSSASWWAGAYLCDSTETPQACDSRLFTAKWGGYSVYSYSAGIGNNGLSSELGMGWFSLDPGQSDFPVGDVTRSAIFEGIKSYYILYVGMPRYETTTAARIAGRRILGVGEPITLRFIPNVVTQRADVLAQQLGGCAATDKAAAYRGTITAYSEAQRQNLTAATANNSLARRLRYVDDRNVNTRLAHEREVTVQLSSSGVPMLVEKGSSSTTYPLRVEVLNRGYLADRTMNVTITPATNDLNKMGYFYVAALVNGQWFGYSETSGWSLWANQSVHGSQRPLVKTTVQVTNHMNLTGLDGVQIYAGYGSDANDLLSNVKYAQGALLTKDAPARQTSTASVNYGYISHTCPATH